MDAEPEDLFTIRNIVNLVPPARAQEPIMAQVRHWSSEYAAWEWSIWTQIALPASERATRRAKAEDLNRVREQEATLVSLDNLLVFPWIRERVEQMRLVLHGWYFGLEAG
ncbi:MAG: carbonic anhydrase [Acidiferrobacteraceae bacterium]